MDKRTLKKWAEREVAYAKFSDESSIYDDYYELALKEYEKILNSVPDEEGLDVVRKTLVHILAGKVLTPIKESDDEWEFVGGKEAQGVEIYYNRRYPYLYKRIIHDGDKISSSYTDAERGICVDINDKHLFKNPIADALIDVIHPIKFPYLPGEKVKIYAEEFKFREDCPGPFDTVAIWAIRLEDGSVEYMERFFKIEKGSTNDPTPIEKLEYTYRVKKYEERVGKK